MPRTESYGEHNRHLDAYVFIRGAEAIDIWRFKGLVDWEFMKQHGVNVSPPAPKTAKQKAAVAFGEKLKQGVRKNLNAVVRSVYLLAGRDDAIVAVTAATFDDLERLVLGPIHKITGNTETVVSLDPPALHPAPGAEAAGGQKKSTAARSSRSKAKTPATRRHHADFAPIAGAQQKNGLSWQPPSRYSAVISVWTNPRPPTEVLADLEKELGPLFKGGSVVAGDPDILLHIGTDDPDGFNLLRKAILERLPLVKGAARNSVALNFMEPPEY